MITSHIRGHAVEYVNGHWQYVDDKTPAFNNRPCAKCGKMPTSEGYDACLGYIPRALWACCGHGLYERYIIQKRKKAVLNREAEGIN